MDSEDGKINGRYPIFNNALAFMWCKIDVSPKDTLISAMKDFYSQDDLKIARDIFAKVSDKRLD